MTSSDNESCGKQSAEKKPICRICHTYEDPTSSPSIFFRKKTDLITPCGCKGTMKYVHKSCLNEWRTYSARSDSFYKCEQCFENYRFRAHSTILMASSKWIIRATSVISLITLIWATSAIVDNGKSMLIDMNIDDDFYYHNGRMHKDFYADADRYEERYGRMAQNTQKYIPYCTSDGHVIDPSIFFKPKSVTNSDAFVKKEVAPTRTCHASDDAASSKCWMPWLEGSVIPFLFTGCTVLAVLQFLIFSPHLHMLFNLLFSLWRMQNYDYKFDCILSLGFSLYGIGRLGYDLHCTIRDSFDRWIKMHLMDLVNR